MSKTEGVVTIGPLDNNDVFYNPPQVFNRDLSMLIAKKYAEIKKKEHDTKSLFYQSQEFYSVVEKILQKGGTVSEFPGINIIEPLAASGLRSFRYALELPKGLVKHVVANDLEEAAVAHIEKNRELNGVSPDLVSASQGDANAVLHAHKREGKEYDIIDLDPYGSVSPFLDSAIYNIKSGGLLCLTSTDMPVLGGNTPEVCFFKYGGNPLKRGFTHELSVRLVLNAAVMTAAKYTRYIKPILCLSVDFYVRLFLIVSDKPFETKLTSYLTAQVFACLNCESFNVIPFGSPPKDSSLNKLNKSNCSASKDMSQGDQNTPKPKRVRTINDETKEEIEDNTSNTNDTTNVNNKFFSFASEHGIAPGVVQNLDILREESRNGNGRCRPGRIPHHALNACGTCSQCGESVAIGGPFYRGATYDADFVRSILNEIGDDGQVSSMTALTMGKRIEGMLSAVVEELSDIPLYYSLPTLFKVVNCSQMPLRKFKGALLTLGYRVSHFHRDAQAIKTDAPDAVVWDIVRLWAAQNPPKNTDVPILKKELMIIPGDFDVNNVIEIDDKKRKAKFLPNPLPNWGPKARADGKVKEVAQVEQKE